jgi:transcriptional regulator with GAF, ATPase, and Fis domain
LALVIVTLGLMLYISFKHDHHDLIKIMVVSGLLACLYINKELGLKTQRGRLAEEVVETQNRVDSLTKKVTTNTVQVMRLEHRLQELNSLHQALRAVNSVTEEDETFDAILRAALDLVGADRGSLMLVDPEHGQLTFASAVGLEDRILNGPGLRIGDRVAGWVAEQGHPVLLTGALDEEGPFEMTGISHNEMNVAMSVPLSIGDRVIGVLNVGSSLRGDKRQFTSDDQRFALLFADHAAMAVDRAGGYGSGRPTAGRVAVDKKTPAPISTRRTRNIEN